MTTTAVKVDRSAGPRVPAPPPPSSAPAVAQLSPLTRSATGRGGTHPEGPAGRRPTPRRDAGGRTPGRRSVGDLAEAFARVYLEVECGRRPSTQALPLLDRRLAAQLEQVWVRPGPPGRVLALTGTRTCADAYEAVAVVRRGARVGALAIRLERRRGRWRVTVATRPEDGPLPEPAYPIPDEEAEALTDLLDEEGQACGGRVPDDRLAPNLLRG